MSRFRARKQNLKDSSRFERWGLILLLGVILTALGAHPGSKSTREFVPPEDHTATTWSAFAVADTIPPLPANADTSAAGRLQQPNDTTHAPGNIEPPPEENKEPGRNGRRGSSRLRTLERDSLGFGADSLHGRRDSLGRPDSVTWVVYKDSTARVAQFVYHRIDAPTADFFPKDNYSLYADVPAQIYARQIDMDTAGTFVTARCRVGGSDVKIPTSMTLNVYIKERLQVENRNSWKKLAQEYKYKETRDELGGLIGNLTNIQIPVPANPLLDIFGGRGINLNVSGAVDIKAAFRNQQTDQVTLSTLDRSQSTPDFNQDVQINVNGTIGDKLKVLADWNTQRTFEYENQLHINYTGYDDEIVQSVEAGNVSLSTPSLVGGGQALFGIKARLQAGPLTLTTLLSQKKGESQSISLSGGSKTGTQDIYPFNYVQNYYFVDTVYAQFWEPLHLSATPTITPAMSEKQILTMDVWESIQQQTSQTAGIALEKRAYVDLPPHALGAIYNADTLAHLDTTLSAGKYVRGFWVRLDPTKDYKYDPYGGYVILNNFSDAQAFAVSYTILGPNGPDGKPVPQVYGDTLGGIGYLKLIKPPLLTQNPEYTIPWKLMLKNIYSLGGRNIQQAGFDLKVARLTNGPEDYEILNANLLNVLGLDRFDQQNNPVKTGDGTFDFINGLTINTDRGELIFPTLRPFDDGIKEYFRDVQGRTDPVPDSLLFPQVYDTTQLAAQNLTIVNKYVMHVHSSSTGQSSVIPLGFNVVEGSVQVLLDGQPLVANVDYTVDYILGQVTIRNQQALAPGRNLQIKYEQNDLFQIASKTMIGARGEMQNILPNTSLGFTIMNLNQATLSDKVRIGEEPTNNTIMGVDASSSFALPFLTSAIDALPFIRTREPSSMRISGEAAYSLPNPNTSTSTIASDNGATVAYIDDFEGSKRTIPLPITYSLWHLASPPLDVAVDDIQQYVPQSVIVARDTATMRTYRKAKLNWYNNSTCFDPVSISEVYGNRKQVHTGQDFLTVLGLNYDPNHRGMYNYSPNLAGTLHRDGGIDPNDSLRRNNWAGVQQYLSNTGNLLDQNMAYIEIWMQTSSGDPADLLKGRLQLDIGRVSEDVIPNGRLNSEDIIHVPENMTGLPRGVISADQDLGLDTLSDSQEKVVFKSFVDANAGDPDVNPEDPSGDDWRYSTCSPDVTGLNGTEGNAQGPTGYRPDTEDLNSNGIVDNDNEYLEYSIPLDSVYVDPDNRVVPNGYIVGGGTNKWYEFRIPLLDAATLKGGATSKSDVLNNVQYFRMWLSGFKSAVNVKIAEMDFVGNQWQTRIPNDSVLKPTVVSIEDNPDYATPDYNALGITRPRDKSDPNQIIQGNEQSLALDIEGLERGESHHVFRSFALKPLNLFNYRELKMFVHGDPNFNYYAPDRYDAEVFLRFGSDTLNYYEYRTPVKPRWDPDNQITIPLADLTSLKALRDSALEVITRPVPGSKIGATYTIKGSPSLTQIREIMVGVTNPSLQGGNIPLKGQIWVNELRLTNVNNDKGYAYHFDTQVKMADLGSFGFNLSRTDPNFHSLTDNFGSQNTTVNWAVNTNVSLDHYFPQSWQGTSIGFGYSHSESIIKPKYLPSSDVQVTAAASKLDPVKADALVTSSQTLQVQDSYSIPNLHLSLPTQWWLIRDTFNKLAFSFSYTSAHSRDPSTTNRFNWQWGFRGSYGVQLPTDVYIQPFRNIFKGILLLDEFKDWKLFYEPITTINATFSSQRSRAYQQTSYVGALPSDSRAFSASKSAGFGWKLTEGGLLNLSGDYGLSVDRNLFNLDNDSVGRGFGRLLNSMFFGGLDSRYSQRITINSKPKVLNIFDLSRYLDLTAGYGVNYAWQNSFAGGDIGKSSGFDNTITLSLNFRLKALTDPWFASTDRGSERELPPRPQERLPDKSKDTSATKSGEKEAPKGNGLNLLSGLKTVARTFIKIPFLDYENIGIGFSQSNRVGNAGVPGPPGFMNFWGRWIFQGSLPQYGPSRLYQLGLISDPTGTLTFTPHSTFPFLGWRTEPGLRAPNATLSDQFGQTNSISLKTNRPLWPGATIDVNWKVAWQYQRNTTILTDSLGNPTPTTVQTGGSIERSYLSIPPVFFFKVFKSNLEDVGKKYQQYLLTMSPSDALTQSFEKGMEAIPFLSKVFGQYVPRPNWSIRWDGIEKIAGLSSVFDKLSLEHNYTSTFRRNYRGDATGAQVTDVEQVAYGFSPLAGINASFKQFLKGSLSGSVRYNTTSTLDLNTSAAQIVETYAQEMAISITYGRHGFKFPLFGLSLTNDIDFTMTYSRTRNARTSYDPTTLGENPDGTPLEGNTRTVLEPQIRYDLSSRVRASIYYQYQRVAPDENASLIYGTTTNEAGLEIHITI